MKPAIPMQECQFSWQNATVERQEELKNLLKNISTAVRAIISCLSRKFTSVLKSRYWYFFSFIIWINLVVYRTWTTSFGGETSFIRFDSSFTITSSSWIIFGIIHLFYSCSTRGIWQCYPCGMATVNIHKKGFHIDPCMMTLLNRSICKWERSNQSQSRL